MWTKSVIYFDSDSGSSGGPERIHTERRRRPGPSQGPRQTAQGPVRDRPSSSGTGGGGFGTGGGGGGGYSFPGGTRGKQVGGGSLILVILCVVVYLIMGGNLGDLLGGGTGTTTDPIATVDQSSYEVATEVPQVVEAMPTSQPKATRTAVTTSGDGPTWLVMLYEDADDKVLEQDIYFDLNEAEKIGSNDRIKIVAQVDRFRGGYSGDGDWTGAKRFLVTQDNDITRVGSEEIDDLGEVNMSDGQTLVDFVTWAIGNFPAEKYALIMSDHGMGWPGGWSDGDTSASSSDSTPLGQRLDDHLYLDEIDAALTQITNETGIEKFELIGMDACLMGQLEVFTMLEPHANYAVASQETEPALGWAYTAFLGGLRDNPEIDGAGLGKLIIDSYVDDDLRLTDSAARSESLKAGSPMASLFELLAQSSSGGTTSSAGMASQIKRDITLAAVDLSAIPDLNDAVNKFAFSLQKEQQATIAKVRTYTQSYTSIFGSDVPASYIDLGNFVMLMKQNTNNSQVIKSGDAVLAAISNAVVAEKHGPGKPGSTGVAIYFPNSQLYQSPMAGPQSYTSIASAFAKQSAWDDFLEFHYTGNNFDLSTTRAAIPASGVAVRGPGAGQITISDITASATSVSVGSSINLSATIRGNNVGYVYLFTGYYDQNANSIYVADMDYLESPNTHSLNGVYYPVWSESGEFVMDFDWEPIMYGINDGTKTITVGMNPESYGATYQDAVYSVDGTYGFADGSPSIMARLYFRDGLLRQVFGFNGNDTAGAPCEIYPQTGDTFTVTEHWMDLDAQGVVTATVTQEGGTLTFGSDMFTWEALNAASGKYMVGFIVEDLDGNKVQAFTQITVK
jgi:hypothetical protein